MELFNESGANLRPQRFQPIGWPVSAPDYNSQAGGEFEKQLTLQKMLYVQKMEKASALVARAGEIGNACLAAWDNDKAKRYIGIMDRLIAYQENLKQRYPLAR